MWYLIVPPIVIVSSILFVLGYLSRKGADPLIASKISQLEGDMEQKVSFSRTKHFLLHTLEKIAHRFKVISLQAHNSLNDMTQSLKEKQKHSQKETPKEMPNGESQKRAVFEDEKTNIEVPLLRKSRIEHLRVFKEHIIDNSQSLKSKNFSHSESGEKEGDVLRPTVSETIVHPETLSQKSPSSIVREENLIAHIAANPKDFSAYEELGDHYLEIGNIKDAKECYRQVLRLSPVQRMAKIKIRRLEKILLQKER